MNTRNINAAGKAETIRTTMEKENRRSRTFRSRSRDNAFLSHLKSFVNNEICYAAINGIAIPVPTR